jgi:HK97 family phage prohead protease
MKLETRQFGSMQFDGNKVVGLIPYNSSSEPLGLGNKAFREQIKPGAFAKSLGKDILALWAHNTASIIGRRKNNSLKLNDTPTGLSFEIDLPNTQAGNDVRELLKAGYVDGASFGFIVPEGGDKWYRQGNELMRDLLSVELREISIVAEPAYPETSAAIRSLEQWETKPNLNAHKLKLIDVATW